MQRLIGSVTVVALIAAAYTTTNEAQEVVLPDYAAQLADLHKREIVIFSDTITQVDGVVARGGKKFHREAAIGQGAFHEAVDVRSLEGNVANGEIQPKAKDSG